MESESLRKDFEKAVSLHYRNMLEASQGEHESQKSLHFRLYHRNLYPYLPKQKQARIVDIGCAFGQLLEYLRSQGYSEISGVEVSQELAEKARRKDFHVECCDAISFFIKSKNQFDCVILYDVIEHLSKESGYTLLQEILEKLSANGRLMLVLPNMGNPLTAARGRYADLTHEAGYTEESISFLLKLAGFKKIQIKAIDHFVLPFPVFNFVGRLFLLLINSTLKLLLLAYGIRGTTVLSKNMLVIAEKF